MSTENPIYRAELDCQLGIKAVHNLQGAAYFCTRLEAEFDSQDTHAKAALFLSVVIRYARPFTPTKTRFGKKVMPIGTLKQVTGFDTARHHHLIHLRDTLLAHDDLDEIMPRIMTTSLSPQGTKLFIPVEFHVSNSSLSHPEKIETIAALKGHLMAALKGSDIYMEEAMTRYRQALIDNPEVARASMTESFSIEQITLGSEWVTTKVPDIMKSEHAKEIEPQAPKFAEAHGGYVYNKMLMKKTYALDTAYDLGDGRRLLVTPVWKEHLPAESES